MKKLFMSAVLLMAFCFSVSGCSKYIHAAIRLPITEPGYESDEVAIAVDFAGVKHIARTECPVSGGDDCKLIYSRVQTGLPGLSETVYSWLPISSEQVYDVDIAVTDGGYAYIVFRWDGRSGAVVDSELWVMRSDLLGAPVLVEGTYKVNGKPIVVARGDVVYVVYDADVGTRHYVRYKRLNDFGAGGWVEFVADTDYAVHDAVVGWNGTLYVVYYHMLELKYADNYGITGNMTNHILISAYSNDTPDIDVNGDPEMVYIIFEKDASSGDDELFLAHCLASSCSGITSVKFPLAAGLGWEITGNPQVISDMISTAYYIFTASNTSTYNQNVYVGNYQVGQPVTAPLQGTVTGENETDPRICLMWSVSPVISWRIDQGGGYYGDVFEFDFVAGARQVRDTTTGMAESDLSCNADWGAGIWNEETPIDKQAWVSFNTYPGLMPMIKR